MTAELSILNKSGVVIAADSAVTIGRNNKVFNSATKLFKLSETQPIGLMIYRWGFHLRLL
jgi:ATP-dependent protease HslVU (ClpYQ) peptidase subunit